MSTAKLEHKDLTSYIISLPKIIIEKIFEHPTTCLAIYRELPELSKLFVMRLLLLNQEVPQQTIFSWVNLPYQKKSLEAIKVLTNLGILQDAKTPGGMPAWTLKASFKKNLYSSIFGDLVGNSLFPITDQTTQKSEDELNKKLDAYSTDRWEAVLKYIVNPKEYKNFTSISTKDILKFAGLMKISNTSDNSQTDSDSAVLTASAFQFLLWNRRVQIWFFIIQLLEFSQKNSKDITECLALLFELSFSTFGKAYSSENFTPTKEYFLQELRTIGLVSMKSRKEKRFYPTRLAIQLANGLSEDEEKIRDETGFIIVETNYRLYAYTTSQLQINLLALFTELHCKFSNLVVGLITRDSIRQAFQMGITAQQIINYLRTNAHPQLCAKKPILPITVTDQINLWYEEKNRCKFFESVHYGQFTSEEDYQILKVYAQELDALIWFSDKKRIMIVKKSSHDAIKRFYKQQKPK